MKFSAKQIQKIISASTKIVGQAVTSSSSSTDVTTSITTALATAGDNGTSVSLVVSSGPTVKGLIVTAPLNRIEIWDSITKRKIADASTNEVYGRLTESSGTYTLSYYYLDITATEQPYTFTTSATIDFDFAYRFNFSEVPADFLISQGTRNINQDPASNAAAAEVVEQLSVTSLNVLTALSFTPNNVLKLKLIINGQTVTGVGGSPAFTVSGGVNITWSSVNAGYSLETTDNVVAIYNI